MNDLDKKTFLLHEDVPRDNLQILSFENCNVKRHTMDFSTYAYNNDRPKNLIRRNVLHMKRKTEIFAKWAFNSEKRNEMPI